MLRGVHAVLSTRLLSALVLIPLVIAAVYLGDFWFAGLAVLVATLATIEFYQISRRLGARPSMVVGTVLAAALVLAARFPSRGIGPAVFVGALAALMLTRVLRQNFQGFLVDWSSTLAGSAYVGGMLSYFVLLRDLPEGLAWVALAGLTTWASDTAAYFVGTMWGRQPFFPKVSPRKTVEGAMAGLSVGTIVAAGIGIPFLRLMPAQAMALGVLLSLAATFGDLAESLVKRQAGVKDSGNLIPGHGGALDRIDSLLFAGVTVYYFAVWVVGAV
jgi:phosphatidate cytidylyltransferase